MVRTACRNSSSVRNTSSGLRNPSPRRNRARRTKQLQRYSLNRGTPQDSPSIAGLVRGIRCSRWTRWAGRPAPSVTAERQTEARARSDRKGPAGRGKVEYPPGGAGSQIRLSPCQRPPSNHDRSDGRWGAFHVDGDKLGTEERKGHRIVPAEETGCDDLPEALHGGRTRPHTLP